VKAVHKKRLLKLAAHLRSGKLGHERFDFSVINADSSGDELTHNGCGALGCAIGECPIAFPRQWVFKNGQPELRGFAVRYGIWDDTPAFQCAPGFFGLDDLELNHLFVPNRQRPDIFGGKELGGSATAKQVAANIEAFVKRKEKESKC
jgi:hypothetical protein